MRRFFICIALLQIYLLIPGSGELTQDLLHYAIDGDSYHQETNSHEHDTDFEHGCSGPYHVCGCHISAAFTPTTFTPAPIKPVPLQHLFAPSWVEEFNIAHGFTGPPFKPPIS